MIKKIFKDLKIGDKSVFEKTITEADVFAFAGISGDFNPLHVSEKFAKNSIFKGRIAHGLLSAALIDYTLTDLVGLGGIHISQSCRFKAPVKIGDSITVESVVVDLHDEKKRLKISSTLKNQNEVVVLIGEAEVMLSE
ncbi:MAG TPA: enoyl-CoA hydratase [Candidatus Atribacteria bacterium]|nr:enoyl-CoA hydratase [Candidatus Atribacteria bacterium]